MSLTLKQRDEIMRGAAKFNEAAEIAMKITADDVGRKEHDLMDRVDAIFADLNEEMMKLSDGQQRDFFVCFARSMATSLTTLAGSQPTEDIQ